MEMDGDLLWGSGYTMHCTDGVVGGLIFKSSQEMKCKYFNSSFIVQKGEKHTKIMFYILKV